MNYSIFFRTAFLFLSVAIISLQAIAQDGEPALTSMGFDASPIQTSQTTSLRVAFVNNGFTGNVEPANIRVQISLPTSKVYTPSPLNGTSVSGAGGALFTWVYNSTSNLLTGTPIQSIGPGVGGEIIVNIIGATTTPGAVSATANIVFLSQTGLTDDPNNNTRTASLDIDAPLPVTLTSFTATKEGSTAQLSWSTTSETNSDRFEIERSQNGKVWNQIGIRQSNGESSSLKNYSFPDADPLPGENLYRLKMIDKDNTFAYSRIESLTFSSEGVTSFYPNPVAEKLIIKSNDFSTVKNVKIYDASGRTVYQSSATPTNEIDVQNFSSGLYVVQLVSKTGVVITHKIIKQ